MEQVQYLLYQSSIGNHILFNNETIRRIAPNLSHSSESEEEKKETEKAERLMEELILCPSIEAKLQFLASLDKKTHDAVAKVYLNIVQNAAAEIPYRH